MGETRIEVWFHKNYKTTTRRDRFEAPTIVHINSLDQHMDVQTMPEFAPGHVMLHWKKYHGRCKHDKARIYMDRVSWTTKWYVGKYSDLLK